MLCGAIEIAENMSCGVVVSVVVCVYEMREIYDCMQSVRARGESDVEESTHEATILQTSMFMRGVHDDMQIHASG